MNNTWLVLVGLVVSALSGAGGSEIIKAITRRRPKAMARAEVEVTLSKQAMEYAQGVEQDAVDARAAAGRCWAMVQEAQQRQIALNRKLDEVQYNVSLLSHYVNWLVDFILLPNTTMEEVRSAVISRKPPQVHEH